MVDISNPVSPQFNQTSPYSTAAISIQQQRNGTVLENAVTETNRANPSKARSEQETLEQNRQKRKKQSETSNSETSNEVNQADKYSDQKISARQNTIDDTTDASASRKRDRARLYSDDNKTLDANEVNLSKANAQSLNTDQLDIERLGTVERTQKSAQAYNTQGSENAKRNTEPNVTRDTEQQNSRTKQDLEPPQAYTQPSSQSSGAPVQFAKSATREKFETLHPELLHAQNNLDSQAQNNNLLKAKFNAVQQQRDVALETRPPSNTDQTARIDRKQQQNTVLTPIQADKFNLKLNPELAVNPRIAASLQTKTDETTATDRIDIGLNADLRKGDIFTQQYEQSQQDLFSNKQQQQTQQTRSDDVVGETTRDNFDSQEIRQVERETRIADNPVRERTEQVNPKSAAVAGDQASQKAIEIASSNDATLLEQISRDAPSRDFDYLDKEPVEEARTQEIKSRFNGGDIANSPERQVQKDADEPEIQVAPAVALKDADARPESQRLEAQQTLVINATNRQDTVLQLKDQRQEDIALSVRKDQTGIRAQGREAAEITKTDLQKRDEITVQAKYDGEQIALRGLQTQAANITQTNRNERDASFAKGAQNAKTRQLDSEEDADLQKERSSVLAASETEAVSDKYTLKFDQRTNQTQDFALNQNTTNNNAEFSLELKNQNKENIKTVTTDNTEFKVATREAVKSDKADTTDNDDFVYTIVEPEIIATRTDNDQAALDKSEELFEIDTSGGNSNEASNRDVDVSTANANNPPANAATEPQQQENTPNNTPDNTTATESADAAQVSEQDAPIVIQQTQDAQDVANKDSNPASNLGDAKARDDLDTVAGTG